MRRLRVAEVLWSGAVGGAERSVLDLAAELDRRRFDARFFFLRQGGWVADKLTAMGFELQVFGWENGYSLGGRWRLARALRAFSPDLIHEHEVPPLTRIWMRLSVPGARLVSSEHGVLQMLVRRRDRLIAFLLTRMEYRLAERVIVFSNYMAEMVKQHYRVPSSRVSVIRGGIDLGEFDPSSERCLPAGIGDLDLGTGYRIGYVGRINNAQKGVDYLPQVAQGLLERGCEDFEIVIAGDGPDRDETQRLCKTMRVDHKVRFCGWQTDVPLFLSTRDLLVVPSRVEAFGLVIVEALAMGVRVVAFDVGGIPEVAGESEDVKLVPFGDVTALVEAILDYKQRFGRSRSLRSRGYVEERYDRVRMARQIEDVYLALVADKTEERRFWAV